MGESMQQITQTDQEVEICDIDDDDDIDNTQMSTTINPQ